MASAAAYSTDRAQIVQNEIDSHLSSTPIFRPSSHRSPSFSSFSSFSSTSSLGSCAIREDHFICPGTPLRFSGIPFSWEQLPGIPKQQVSNDKKESSQSLLPLPPAGNTSSSFKKHIEEISPKKSTSESFRKDPFFTALVECSKDDEVDTNVGGYWKGPKVTTRTLSDRIGFVNMYTSCKRTCAVSESIVYLPRSSTYTLPRRRSS